MSHTNVNQNTKNNIVITKNFQILFKQGNHCYSHFDASLMHLVQILPENLRL